MGDSAGIREGAKRILTETLPLSFRKSLSRLVGKQQWLKGRYWYSMELIRDLAEERPEEFHRFLWENHIGYAESYEVEARFGEGNLHPSRKLLFEDLLRWMESEGLSPAEDIESVFEVGCSMGYLLRHMETTLFPSARSLEGIDIDQYAIRRGALHLAAIGSGVRIRQADMEALPELLAERQFDLVVAAGVLMYLPMENARAVVGTLLRHTRRVLVLTGPACSTIDNRRLDESQVRERDQTLIHNLDRMVESEGGKVVFRRWEGTRRVDGNTLYFVFAEPGPAFGRENP